LPFTQRFAAIAAVAFLMLYAFQTQAASLTQANDLTRRLVQETMAKQRIPGMQVAVVKDDRVVFSESFGWANVENRVPATKTTLFPINSATKSFTGVAIMQLVEAGHVDLNAPVSRYIDDLPEAWRGIRVRQLLAHTSGLPDILDEQGLLGGGSEINAWQAVKRLPVGAPAGERFTYNQTNYILLAQIIEKQSKLPYERYIATRQFAPAHMARATFGDSYDLLPNAATMYSYFPRKTDAPGADQRLSHWFYDISPGLWSGGGMMATADDVAHWLISVSKGELISKAGVRAMWTPEKLNSGADGDWAAGWLVLKTTPVREVAGLGGARAAFIVYPDERLAVVVLTNLVGSNPQNFIPKIAEGYRAKESGATEPDSPAQLPARHPDASHRNSPSPAPTSASREENEGERGHIAP
jgi:CubicO group peptidase (beta-lactamase class C family)